MLTILTLPGLLFVLKRLSFGQILKLFQIIVRCLSVPLKSTFGLPSG